MDTTTVQAAQTASETAQNFGIAGALGALFMKLVDYGLKIFPALNEGKKLDKKIDDHKSLCAAEIKGKFDVLENRLQNGNSRFQSLEDRAQEDRELAAQRHAELVGYFMKITRGN